MNEETYEALKSLLKVTRLHAGERSKKKRKSYDEVFNVAVLYRDLVQVENWVKEIAKEYN